MLKYSIIALLAFISYPLQACQIIQSSVKDEYYIGESCPLIPLATEHNSNTNTVYFVQYLFANSFYTYVDIKGAIQNKLTFPIANQPFNHGYRMMVGPLSLDDAKYVQSRLQALNYPDALIKSYTPQTPQQALSLPQLSSSMPPAALDNTLTYPDMTPVYSLGGYMALLPTYHDDYQGKVTKYNQRNLGSFTYQQARAVCSSANSRIANEQDYNVILSNTGFMMKYAVKSQFWLTPSQTITRVHNQVITRKQNPSAHFNVICITK